MYTGMYSSQQEATNKRLVRFFELITNIFINLVFKAIQVIPLAQGFLPIYTWIGKFYQREQ